MNHSTKIYIGNIPFDYNENELLETLEMVGPVKGGLDIKKDADGQKSRGFGFYEYKDQESKISALKNLKSIDYNGRQLDIGTEKNQKNNITTEEQLRLIRDFSFIKESFLTLSDLSEDQKLLIFITTKLLFDNFPREFDELLKAQDEGFLNEFLMFQEEFMSKYQS